MPGREFKVMIIKTLDLRKEWKASVRPLTEIRNNIAEIKGSINKIRSMLNRMNSMLEEAEEQINDLEDRVMESNQEQKREKIIMQNKNGHKELSDSTKCINIHILGVPEGNCERGKNLFEEIIAENFPQTGEGKRHTDPGDMDPPIKKLNKSRSTARHTVIKLAKYSDKPF